MTVSRGFDNLTSSEQSLDQNLLSPVHRALEDVKPEFRVRRVPIILRSVAAFLRLRVHAANVVIRQLDRGYREVRPEQVPPDLLSLDERLVIGNHVLDAPAPLIEVLEEENHLIQAHVRVADDVATLEEESGPAVRLADGRSPYELELTVMFEEVMHRVTDDDVILWVALRVTIRDLRVDLNGSDLHRSPIMLGRPELTIPTASASKEIQNPDSIVVRRIRRHCALPLHSRIRSLIYPRRILDNDNVLYRSASASR